ncbi:MAG: Maf family protein [Halanaerobiaceae bacterium]
MTKIVLASRSPRRQELMKMLGFDFTTVPGKIDEEKYFHLKPAELVQKLARAKVEEVAGLVEDTVIIGADTVVVMDNRILGKPENLEDAKEILGKLQDRHHSVLTGLAVYDTVSEKERVDYDRTDVYMREMTEEEIDGYVKTGEPMDKAGAYGIQGIGGIFVEKINGSFFTVMGLPIHKLILMLKEFSIDLFN